MLERFYCLNLIVDNRDTVKSVNNHSMLERYYCLNLIVQNRATVKRVKNHSMLERFYWKEPKHYHFGRWISEESSNDNWLAAVTIVKIGKVHKVWSSE